MFAKICIKTFGCIALASVCLFSSGCSSKKAGDDLGGLSESDLAAQREGRYGEGSIPMAEGSGLFKDINFGYDSSAIDEIGRQNLEYNVQVLQANPQMRVQIEGHCDERGTADYNLALGSQRAKAVLDLLLTYGVAANRLESISYGEEVPLDPAQNEDAYAKNRRAHLSPFAQR
jgi:peptidoglycan-associated lipoprotein